MLQRPGASLSIGKGFAPFSEPGIGATIARALAIGLPGIALVAALGGVWFGLGEPSLAGLSVEAPGGHVQSVDPASSAWAAGVRPGQVVVASADALAPGGWSVVTSDGVDEHAVRATSLRAGMRAGLIASGFALALVAGTAASRRRRRRAELFATVALSLGWVPFALAHDTVVGPAIGALAGPALGLWIGRWVRKDVGAAVVLAALGLDLGWLGLRLAGAAELPDLDGARFAFTMAGTAALVACGFGMTARSLGARSKALRDADLLALVGAALVTILVQVLVDPPPFVPVLILAIAAIAYGRFRAALRRWVDRAMFAEARERVSIESAESERARLSRELHDDPLQSLVGVILSLEHQPGTEGQQAALRGVAEQLRRIATNLHPPVLDDLGLVPAVETLFAEPGPVPVMLELDHGTGFGSAERLPFDVELAAYRIIAEATTNALRHSGCQTIVVRGRISADSLAIDVIDDGSGVTERDLEAALRRGHLGVASMRRRAEAIDAQLVHGPNPEHGTTVSLRWSQ
jgi:signal transduction histidine kinase